MRDAWNSPYQTREYFEAVKNIGVPMEEVAVNNQQKVYFDGSYNTMIAWEVSADVDTSNIQLDNRVIFQQSEDDHAQDAESYYTLVISPSSEYSRRFKRSIHKSNIEIPNATLSIAETRQQIDLAVNFFQQNPERRDNLPMEDFRKYIVALGQVGILTSYVLQNSSEMLGVAHVLKSDDVVNLRYYSADRIGNAGHLLHHKVIEDIFTNTNIETIDLSGISPFSTDDKMIRIDEFKNQIGGKVIEFTKIVNEPDC